MNKTSLSTYNNSWYNTGGSTIKRLFWYFFNILFFVNPLNPLSSLKVSLLRLFGAKVGKGVRINPSVNIKYPWLLEIGDYSWIGEKVWIDNLTKVTIGNNCCISQGAMLLTGNHNYKKSTFDLMIGEIILEDGAWVGAQSTVCPGVTLKSHAILSVGSVATKDLEAYSIYQGNPAVKVRDRKIEE
ncbi:MAG: colanic acid biosynthesis acetyltransferase WcaF [Rickettsiales bacterium]|nr:colanic acid biosynthesis acetyltransferase WcaF [Rickettsiales bacterium]